MKPRYWHYWIGLLLGVALVPILRRLHLPVSFDWIPLSVAYWFILAAQSIFVASILCLIGLSWDALGSFIEHYRRNPLRIVFVLLYFVILGWAFTWVKALVLMVDTVAILEFRERRSLNELGRAAGAILLPAFYLFAGFLMVLAYNSIIVTVRFNFAYDPAFHAMDKWILRGWSVCDLSDWAVRKFPVSFFRFLEFIYFGMFPQIGAGMIIVSLLAGKHRGLQFVGTLLTAYYLALGLFYLWPSHGPYYLCAEHFSLFPITLQAYVIQRSLIAHALALWNHVPIHRISTDYFIAFPCMHIAQPLIVMWFLRRWRRMVIALCAYDALLVMSILLLQWHYVVDIIGGVLVAGIAIAMVESSAQRSRWNLSASHTPTREDGIISR
jgi:hypothetical protein